MRRSLAWIVPGLVLAVSLPARAEAPEGRGGDRKGAAAKNAGGQEGAIGAIQRLINEGELEQVEALLADEGDEAVLESFRGMLALKREKPEQAVEHFRRVLAIKPNQTAIWLYLGQALFQCGRYRESLEALDRGKSIGRKLASYYRLRARAQQHLDRIDDAYRTLEQGRRRFPREHGFVLEQALLLVHQGLYTAALKKGGQYLGLRPDDRDGYLVLGEVLRRAGRPRQAARVLEQARLRFPNDPDVLARLGFAHAADGRLRVAARLLSIAARVKPEYAFSAAEYYRLAGRFERAIEINARVPDPAQRLSQRLAIHVGSESFDRAAALELLLRSAGAMNELNRYRLAYANLRAGELERARQLALEVRDPTLRPRAEEVLRSIREQEGRTRTGSVSE